MKESKTAVIAALAGNGALAVLKGISAAATGSAAMLAETFHSVADTGNQALLLLGLRLGRRAPNEAHPFGHGKNVYFWAFVVSVMLFTLGGALAILARQPRPHADHRRARGRGRAPVARHRGRRLIGVAVLLGVENYALIIGESAPGDVEARIRSTISRDRAVERLQALHTMHLGPHAASPAWSVPRRRAA